MQRSKNDLWVGLFVLIGGLAILFMALQAANLLNLSFQSTYRIEARFDNIGQGLCRREVFGLACEDIAIQGGGGRRISAIG